MEYFVTSHCLYCEKGIEFDTSLYQTGTKVECPHCHQMTQLYIGEQGTPPLIPKAEPQPETFSSHDWRNDPMSEKQKAMFVLYGIDAGLVTKGEASKLIDEAKTNGVVPNVENQIIAAQLFGKIRLEEIIEEVFRAIKVVGNPNSNITSLRDAKRNVKESVKSLTDIIDRRIELNQMVNAEARNAKVSEWLKEHGFIN